MRFLIALFLLLLFLFITYLNTVFVILPVLLNGISLDVMDIKSLFVTLISPRINDRCRLVTTASVFSTSSSVPLFQCLPNVFFIGASKSGIFLI